MNNHAYSLKSLNGSVVLSNLDTMHYHIDSNMHSQAFKQVYVVGYPKTKPMNIKLEPSISMTGKLIIIDGKEATGKEMNNLKASEIKSISVRNDDKTKEKYGDKAKNGVLYISTTKS